jgi:hypothetical protein
MKARTATCLALFCSSVFSLGATAGCGAPDEADLHKVYPIDYLIRGEMGPDNNLWGGWTDGTVQYTYDETSPAPDSSIVLWAGQMVIQTISIATAQKDPDFDDASFQIILASPNAPKALKDPATSGILHPHGLGWKSVGGSFSYDANGAGEDLTDFAEGGVVFFAKAGTDPNAPKALTLSFNSPDFSPVAAKAVGAAPDTSAHCGNAGYSGCYDVPSVGVALRPFWRQFIIPFRVMRQQGYGYPVTDFYEKRGLTADVAAGKAPFIAFGLPKNAPFDFWLAGFGFYTKAAHDQVLEY